MRVRTSLRAELERTRRDLIAARQSVDHYRRSLERSEKRRAALAHGITALCARDRTFMLHFHESNTDPDLCDVYNELLYAYGRTCPNGCKYTRLSCPWWDHPQEKGG